MDRRPLVPGAAAFVAAGLVALLGLRAGADTPPDAAPPGVVRIQLLGLSDLHGHLESDGEVGGAAWLAAHLERAADSSPGQTILVHAGDMVGASPLISSYFRHRSTVEAINLMHFDVGTLGNHEFDNGGDELEGLLRRVRIPYVSANVLDRERRLRLPPYRIVERAGVRVGFIGVTTPTASRYLLTRYARRFRFLDISESVNRWVPDMRRRGVDAIVVLAHSGAYQAGRDGPAAGEIVDEARQMSDAVDVIVAGHTHSYLNTRVGQKLIVQAYPFGAPTIACSSRWTAAPDASWPHRPRSGAPGTPASCPSRGWPRWSAATRAGSGRWPAACSPPRAAASRVSAATSAGWWRTRSAPPPMPTSPWSTPATCGRGSRPARSPTPRSAPSRPTATV